MKMNDGVEAELTEDGIEVLRGGIWGERTI